MGLSTVARDLISPGSLKKLIRTKYASEKTIAPLTTDGWLRASAFAGLCPREEVLCVQRQVTRTDVLTPDNMLTLLHGKSLHWGLQNDLLPGLGLMVGKWLCLGCGATYGGGFPLETQLVYRPALCVRCPSTLFQYEEQMFFDEQYRVNGHPDGFLIVPGLPGTGIVEAKSIGTPGAIAARQAPQIGHVVQVHIYLWLTGLKWAKIIYWEKGGNGVSAIIEHHLDRDEETIANIKKTAMAIWDGIRLGVLPERVCAAADCNRALRCTVRKPCFSLEES